MALLALAPHPSATRPRVGHPLVFLEHQVDGSTIGHTPSSKLLST